MPKKGEKAVAAKPAQGQKQEGAKKAGKTAKQLEEEEIQLLQEMTKEAFKNAHPDMVKKAAHRAEHVLKKRHEAMQKLLEEQQIAEEAAQKAAAYVNAYQKLDEGTEWFEVAEGKWLRYEQFKPEQLEGIVTLLSNELSEPYNCFTYEHFLGEWPDLGIVAYGAFGAKPAADFTGEMVGTAISKVSRKSINTPLRGYIAMLAVTPKFRGHRIGQKLVTVTVNIMRRKGVDEVVLETPTSNERALKLYEGLGFARAKFLHRYYLDGQDAIRLKLWLRSAYEPLELPTEIRNAIAARERANQQAALMAAAGGVEEAAAAE